MKNSIVLALENLEVSAGNTPILRGLSFTIKRGQTLGIVGESGCGKTTLALAIMGLLPQGIHITNGSVFFKGENITTYTPAAYRSLRGRHLAMIVQDPRGAFNPLITIGQWMQDVMLSHFDIDRQTVKAKAYAMLEKVELPDLHRIWRSYPFQLSGGMLQRVLIATALCLEPEVLIADEPTTALDATVRRQVVELLKKIQQETDLTLLVISHDFGIIRTLCAETIVMYAGEVVESGDTEEIIQNPLHPYTRGLIHAIPRLHDDQQWLSVIPGEPPQLIRERKGCPFAPRCPEVIEKCEQQPPLQFIARRQVRCWQPLTVENQ